MAIRTASAGVRRGQVSHAKGAAAEERVAALYGRQGHRLVGRRWRGKGGEIDLIMRDGDTLVFVEVKSSRSFDRAAERITARQIARIFDAAGEFVANEPQGLNSDMRFDLALVDGRGAIEIRRNAFL
ncbi:YraN family protein [Rhodobacteraceae bacterium CCMM004]|nr:YraN family protein [Rhodobacteraceae bacterium CCMM004]